MVHFLKKLFQKNEKIPNTISIQQIWWIPALVPLCIALSSLIHGEWSWGLMDDHHLAFATGTINQKFFSGVQQFLKAGRFFPVFTLHTSVFYSVFKNSPKSFFIFRWLEVACTLGLWGHLSAQITQRKWAAPLFIAVTLSFFKFYDSLFYLSTQEILGCFFSGLTLLLFYRALKPASESNENLGRLPLLWAGICLFLTFMCKEPFVSIGIAIGISIIASWFKQRDSKKLLIIGVTVLCASILYALVLKLFIAQSYSADYSLTDTQKIAANIGIWFKNVLKGHSPWIAISLIVMCFSSRSASNPKLFMAKLLGPSLYMFFLALIIPWQGWGHYVTPLGVFFAFTITIFLANRLSRIPKALLFLIITLSLSLNIFVGGKAISSHEKYQYDTHNLKQWMAQNALFKHDVLTQKQTVRCNATEPSYAIPRLVNKENETSFSDFIFTSSVREIIADPQTKYFIWGVHWGNQDLRRLGEMWSPMFFSDNWIVFRRMIN